MHDADQRVACLEPEKTVILLDGVRFDYIFRCNLSLEKAKAVSMTLPLQEEAYTSPVLFPFFDGLIPEGWLLDVALRNTDISILDRMALLLTCCKDCIGAVSVIPLEEKEGSHV